MESLTRRYSTPLAFSPALKARVCLFPLQDLTIQAAIHELMTRAGIEELWEKVHPDADSVFETAAYVRQMLENFMSKSPFIGMVYATINEFDEPHALFCDGLSHAKEDYPDLWEITPVSMRTATSFETPNLSGKFVRSEGNGVAMHEEGGASAVSISVSEMPEHSHSTNPHTHGYIGAGLGVPSVIPGPNPTAVPAPFLTDLSTVTVNPTGSGQPHENLPPFYALVYKVWAV